MHIFQEMRSKLHVTHRHNFVIQNALVPLIPDGENNFSSSLVLDLRISQLCVKTLCK